ncbi:MAG: cob(I)yrinic acid a,c-diamide adenosyltransferase [Gammaproteobacteria bacterium]|nr:MAG: cob(I)yrinic acid a,c-diamide adenosyltransferase [Gammaproteobacteria bacterium]
MGNRLTKIYTKTGDSGLTGLADGSRTEKDSLRIFVIGDVDELNSLLGLLIAINIDEEIKACLLDIQNILFDLGGELAIPDSEVITEARVQYLEKIIDQYNASLPPLKEFILPGGSVPAAVCHTARAVCRRTERQLVGLSREISINNVSLKFLNRLSDLLFIFARTLALSEGGKEIYWQSERIKD